MTAARRIASKASKRLQPFGFRKARSRLWYQDHGWWLTVVSFDAGSNPGTYLAVAAMWLWHDKDYWSYDFGGRVYWRRDGRHTWYPPPGEPGWAQFLGEDEFGDGLEPLLDVALAKAAELAERFTDPVTTAAVLDTGPHWETFDKGAAAALCGDTEQARRLLSSITAGPDDPPWKHDQVAGAAALAAKPESVRDVIAAARTRLKGLDH